MTTGKEGRKAKVVLAASGSHGDVHPFIAVSLALKAQGLEAVIATRETFRAKVEAEGLGFAPVRPDLPDIEARFGLDQDAIARAVANPRRGVSFMVRTLTMDFLRESLEDSLAALEGADLVVAHTTAVAARLAAETRGLPWLSAVLQPFSFLSAQDRPSIGVSPLLDRLRPLIPAAAYRRVFALLRGRSETLLAPYHALRSELGLTGRAPNPLFEGQFSARGVLGLYSPLLGPVRSDYPPNTALTGFCFYDGREPLDPALQRFLDEGPSPVVFTLGTAAALDAGDFFIAARAAARRLGARAVFLTGPDPRTALPGLGPDMISRPYAPYSEVFPRARAIVHQAGVGTIGEALRAGRPQVCVPFLVDQPDNAARIRRLGVAAVVPRQRCNEKSLAAAISGCGRPAVEDKARACKGLAGDGAQSAASAIIAALSAP